MQENEKIFHNAQSPVFLYLWLWVGWLQKDRTWPHRLWFGEKMENVLVGNKNIKKGTKKHRETHDHKETAK